VNRKRAVYMILLFSVQFVNIGGSASSYASSKPLEKKDAAVLRAYKGTGATHVGATARRKGVQRRALYTCARSLPSECQFGGRFRLHMILGG